MGVMLALHLLAAVIWVGGMFFAYVVLRPVAATELEPPVRLRLWRGVFQRFFGWVWASVLLLWGTGLGMVLGVFGSFARVGLHVHLMLGLGLLMTLLFLGLYLSPWRALKRAVDGEQWPEAGAALNRIRGLVAFNLSLGVLLVVIASGGRYLL
ncbi:CopD family protein [Aestuariirhabdus litorea]|uniref:Copper resistance protein D domain-containing protein n=1 Tax=Aestuariirhabdus litorea TaxID=2528527 RepID=A0A3P3VRC0_9GAMM|nr:CopD family protein [Aestuariirhabdus litorea]RRJ85332.1 hypothetical protein D0544_09805 [Aestuariirhabdus litorea]RWW98554.1 hypothetical protein DZC74_09790 [Endozoicomonadaceae bacterium GTF-13]